MHWSLGTMNVPPHPTYVAVLTPAGRGAVAVVRVEGPAATSICQSLLCLASGRPLVELPLARIAVARWSAHGECISEMPQGGSEGIRVHAREMPRGAGQDSLVRPSETPWGAGEGDRDGPGEEVVVCRRAADVIEIGCHGGRAAIEALVTALQHAGCRRESWSEWIARTAADPLEAAARAALADAPTRRVADILLAQASGALRAALDQLDTTLARGAADEVLGQLDLLLARAPMGLHLTRPWRVVLAGAPNVGKSSLINALAGFQRAITDSQPGTTRDVVTTATAVAGWPVTLSDTAGLRETRDPLEGAGIARARDELAAADLVVWVDDATRRDLARIDIARKDALAERATRGTARVPHKELVVCNKCDLVAGPLALPAGVLATSALTGEGIERLIEAIAANLVPAPPDALAAVPFTAEQVAALDAIRMDVARGALDAARGKLHEAPLGRAVGRPPVGRATLAAANRQSR